MRHLKLLFPPALDEISGGILRLSIPTLISFLRKNRIDVEQDDLLEKVREVNRKSFFGNKINLNLFRISNDVIDYVYGIRSVRHIEEVCDSILSLTDIQSFDIIGFSVHSIYEFPFALALSKRIKEKYKKKIIIGGRYITLEGYLYTGKLKFIDKVFTTNSELELLNYLNRGKPQLKQKITIENLPAPDFDGLPMNLYMNNIHGKPFLIIPYTLTRGCTNKCNFCTHNLFHNIEFKSIGKVIREIQELSKKYNSIYFEFCDSSLNMSYRYIENICDKIIKLGIDIRWTSMIMPDKLDKKLLTKMKKSGCTLLRFGVESAVDDTIKKLGKSFTSKDAINNMRTAKKLGVKTEILLITGYVNETDEEVEKTIQMIRENSEIFDMALISILRIRYGSKIYKNPKKYGIHNLRIIKSDIVHGLHYGFDEIGGLKWDDKRKQQIRNRKKISSVIFREIAKRRSILSGESMIKLIPYPIYYYVKTNLYSNNVFRKIFFIYCKISKERYPPPYIAHYNKKWIRTSRRIYLKTKQARN